MLNFVILLLTKQDISTTEKMQKGRELKAKETMNGEPRKRKKEEKERWRMIQSSWGLIVCSECLV